MRSSFAVCSSFIVIVLGMLMVLAGCGPVYNADAAKSEEVDLSVKDHGSQIEVDVAQSLVLTLESNPTTGFRWELVGLEDAVLQPMGDAEFKVASELDPPPPGTGGVEIYRFEAVDAGETLLELVYRRPWEEGVEPLETFSIRVTAR